MQFKKYNCTRVTVINLMLAIQLTIIKYVLQLFIAVAVERVEQLDIDLKELVIIRQ